MPVSGSTSQASKDASLTTSRRGFSIAPSPFNGVKFELGVVLVLGVLLLLIQGRLSDSLLVQSLILGGYGVLGMLWILWRTHQVLRRLEAQQDSVHGPQP